MEKKVNLNVSSILSVVILLTFTVMSTAAICCYSYHPGICADCSSPTFLGHCPAVDGDCNIFGCNCVNGCRQPPSGRIGCAPTDHLFHPRGVQSEKNCWLMDENEKCKGRVFRRVTNS